MDLNKIDVDSLVQGIDYNVGVTVCLVDDCERFVRSRGLCVLHYVRFRKLNPGDSGLMRVACIFPGCERVGEGLGRRSIKCLEHHLKCVVVGCVKATKGVRVRGPGADTALCYSHQYNQKRGLPLDSPIGKPRGTQKWYKNTAGYVSKNCQEDNKRFTVFQHREVMEKHLGRKLVDKENVHHINGVRDDNRIENLELWSSSQPYGQRVSDKVSWAKEILKLYEGVDFMEDGVEYNG